MGICGSRSHSLSRGHLQGVLPYTAWWVKSTGTKNIEKWAIAGLKATVGHAMTQEQVLACGLRLQGLGPLGYPCPGVRDKLQSQL